MSLVVVLAGAGCGGQAARRASRAAPAPVGGAGPTRAVARSVQPASNATLTPSCQIASPRTTLGPQATLPANPTQTLVSPAGGIVDFAAGPLGLSIETPDHLLLDSLSGATEHTVTLPAPLRTTELGAESLAIDATGATYVSAIRTRSSTSFPRPASWSGPALSAAIPTAYSSWASARRFASVSPWPGRPTASCSTPRAGRAGRHAHRRVEQLRHLRAQRRSARLREWPGQDARPGGGILLHEFGAELDEGQDARTGGPYQFYYPGQAAVGPGGVIYTADPLTTMVVSSPTGLLQAATNLGGHLTMSGGRLFIVGGDAYFEGGTPFSSATTVSSVSLATLGAYLAPPQGPLDALGWGAGVSTPAAGNYFPAGARPVVTASFAPWWREMAGHLQLRYAVWDAADLARLQPPTQTIAVPATAAAAHRFELPLPPGDAIPGPYEVEASLYDTSEAPARLIGSTCLPYSVGAPGDQLDLATLPASGANGEPSDLRDIALNAELGLDGFRGGLIDWSTFLPSCNASHPTMAQCGPGAFTASHAPVSYFQAAALAARDHITYWVQVTGGDAISTALVAKGWWQDDIKAPRVLLQPSPHQLRRLRAGDRLGAVERTQHLRMGHRRRLRDQRARALLQRGQGGRAGAKVIGGSTLEVPLSWWQSLIAAHGLSYLDVAAVHPYPGNNDSLEEDGILSEVEELQHLLGHVPLWFTEVGWWGDGDYNVVNQANDIAQAVVLQRTLGIPVWNYYYSEGAGGTGNVSLSLIQTVSGDDYVKAGALATMVVAHQTADRPYLGTIATGIPSTHAVGFGPSGSGDPTDLLAVWSDGLATTGELHVSAPTGDTVPVTLVDEYGASTPATLRSGAPYALPIRPRSPTSSTPKATGPSIEATEAYGANLALASTGAQASASSGEATAVITGWVTGTGWSSAAGQSDPTLTVTLPRPAAVDRVVVDTQSPGSTATGLRNYTVAIHAPGEPATTAGWVTVGQVVGEYHDHQEQITFASRAVIAVRITVSAIDYGGYADGGVPNFWPVTRPGWPSSTPCRSTPAPTGLPPSPAPP